MKIASAGNSDTAAFHALIKKGYSVWVVPKSDGNTGWYVAKKENQEFIGDNFLETIGLIAMFEARGEDWKPTDKEVEELEEFEATAFSKNF